MNKMGTTKAERREYRREYQRQYYQKHKEKAKEYQRQYSRERRLREGKPECRPRGRQITFQGKTQCLSKWAAQIGVSRQVLEQRLKVSKWPLEKALTLPIRSGYHKEHKEYSNAVKVSFLGITRLLEDWAEQTGISYNTLYNRLNTLGWPVEKAFKTPVGNQGRKKDLTWFEGCFTLPPL